MSLYVSDLIKMERLLKPNPLKSSPLQTAVFRHSLDGEDVYCLYIETRCSWLNYLKQRASADRQLVAAVITGLLLTVCVVSLQFCQLNTHTDEASCLLKVSYRGLQGMYERATLTWRHLSGEVTAILAF